MKQDPDLDTLLGYRLQQASLLLTSDARRALGASGLSPAKITALLMVRANPGCDQSALARALDINRSSAMKLVNGLVALGLIERRPGRDLRSNALHLLSQGTSRLDDLMESLRESDRRMSNRLTEEQRETLFALLRKLG